VKNSTKIEIWPDKKQKTAANATFLGKKCKILPLFFNILAQIG
jgi:hypothetical protein